VGGAHGVLVYTRQQQLLLAMGYFKDAATLRCARSSSAPAPPATTVNRCQTEDTLNGVSIGGVETRIGCDTNADHWELYGTLLSGYV